MAVLGTKVHVPTLRRDLVERPRLTARLDGAAHRGGPAPPGAGVGAGRLRQDDRAGPRTRTPSRPARTTSRGCRSTRTTTTRDASSRTSWPRLASPEVEFADAAALVAAHGADRSRCWPAWSTSSTSAARAGPCWRSTTTTSSTAPAVHEAVTFLLDNLPPQVTLAMTTRADPPLPLSRLRARGELVEIRAADLRFTADEADGVPQRRDGARPRAAPTSPRSRRAPRAGPPGCSWPPCPLRARADDVAAFVEAFAGSHRFVLDYLVEEVLGRQPADVRVVPARHLRARQLTGDAVRRASPAAPTASAARGARAGEPVRRPARRRAPAGTATTTSSPTRLRARLTAGRPERVGEPHRGRRDWYADDTACPTPSRHALSAGRSSADLRAAAGPADRRRRAATSGPHARVAVALPDDVVRARPLLALPRAGPALGGRPRRASTRGSTPPRAALARRRPPTVPGRPRRAGRRRTGSCARCPAMVAVYRASVAQARGDVDRDDRARPTGPRRSPGRTTTSRAGRARASSGSRPGRRRPRRPRSTRSPRRSRSMARGRRRRRPARRDRRARRACGWRGDDPTRHAGSTSARWRRPRAIPVPRCPPPATCTSASPTSCASRASSTRPRSTCDAAARARRVGRRCWRTGTAGTSRMAALLRARG